MLWRFGGKKKKILTKWGGDRWVQQTWRVSSRAEPKCHQIKKEENPSHSWDLELIWASVIGNFLVWGIAFGTSAFTGTCSLTSQCPVCFLGHWKDLGVRFKLFFFKGNFIHVQSSTLSLWECTVGIGLTFYFKHTLGALLSNCWSSLLSGSLSMKRTIQVAMWITIVWNEDSFDLSVGV